MATSTTNVDYYGISLDCEFEWSPYRPQTYWDPAEGGFECITKVMHHGEDIMELLSDSVIEGLEIKIQEDYE